MEPFLALGHEVVDVDPPSLWSEKRGSSNRPPGAECARRTRATLAVTRKREEALLADALSMSLIWHGELWAGVARFIRWSTDRTRWADHALTALQRHEAGAALDALSLVDRWFVTGGARTTRDPASPGARQPCTQFRTVEESGARLVVTRIRETHRCTAAAAWHKHKAPEDRGNELGRGLA